MVTIPNKWIGIYSGTSSTAPVHYSSYDWYEYKGEKGDTGDAAEVTSTAIVYQASESGTTVPTGTWVDTVPTVVQGQFLWTRVTVNWNDGTSAVWYSVSYVAIDGEGSPGSQTPLVDSGSGVVGTATAYSRQDHQHPLNVPSSGEPAMDGTASRGNADTYSRSDHVHPTDTSRARVADMAAAYSQRTYAKGELCIYENVLYRCNSSHWETTNIGVELGDLNGAINQTDNNIAYRESGNTASRNYTWNDYVVVNGQLYRVKTNISQGNTFTVGTNIEASYALSGTYGIVVTPTIVEPTYFELASYDTQVIGNFIFGSVSVKCIANSNANPGLFRFNMLSKPAYGWQLGMITDQWGRNPSGFARCYCVANASTNNRLEIGGIQMTAGQYCTIILAMPVSKV